MKLESASILIEGVVYPCFFTLESRTSRMAYFGIDPERYGGWTQEEKDEALENSELPPGREPRGEDDDD